MTASNIKIPWEWESSLITGMGIFPEFQKILSTGFKFVITNEIKKKSTSLVS